MRVKAWLSGVLLALLGGSGLCADPIYFTSPTRNLDQDQYDYLLTYCTEVKDTYGLSITYGPSAKIDGTDVSSIIAQLSLIPRGYAAGHLFLKKDIFFSDKANVSVGDDCLLSSSDSSSTQQIQAILTAVGQTIGTALTAAKGLTVGFALGCDEDCVCPSDTPADVVAACRQKTCDKAFEHYKPDPRAVCGAALRDAIRSVPYYRTLTKESLSRPVTINSKFQYDASVNFPDRLRLVVPDPANAGKFTPLVCKKRIGPYSVAIAVKGDGFKESSDIAEPMGEGHDGFRAYTAHPVMVRLACNVTGAGTSESFDISAPQVLLPHRSSEWIAPTRDFFTSPTDAWMLGKGGFVLRHDHSVQSPAKTVVDIITTPFRASIPTVQVQNTVVSSPGKADTTTTAVTTSAPK